MKNENKIKSAAKWSAATSILKYVSAPLTNMILARILQPEVFGVVASLNIIITFADLFTDAGFQKYLVQHEFKEKQRIYLCADVAFWSNLALSIVIWIGIWVSRNTIAEIVGSRGYGNQLAIAALSIPLLSFSSIQQALYRRNFSFDKLFFPRIVRSLIPFFVTVPIAIIFHNEWSLVIGTVAANFSDAVFLTWKSQWKPRVRYSVRVFREMFSFSAWSLLESLSIWLTTNIDVFIVGRILSNYYLGLYKTSINTVEQITAIISQTVIPILFTSLSRTQMEDNEFYHTFYEFQKKGAIVVIPLCVGIFLYKDLITLVFLGSKWVEASFFIGLYGLSKLITLLISNFASEVYRAKGEPMVSFATQIAYIVILYLAIKDSALKGYEEVCLMRSLLAIAFAVIHLWVLKFRYRFRFINMLKNCIQPVFATIVMTICAIALQKCCMEMQWQLLSVWGCIVIYFGTLCVFGENRRMLSQWINRRCNHKKDKL
ncbi:MAG: lipopolysaccharide biosynthesis protein [Lachnospiraceae bacterium]